MEIAGVRQQIEVRAQPQGVAAQSVAPPTTLTSHQVLSIPLSQKQKFVDALPLVPGVVRTPEGQLNLKGAAVNQGIMLVNSTQAVDPVTGSFAIQMPLDVIQTLQVLNTPYSAQYGGFSGGLTSVQTKPPIGRWHYGLMDFIPGVRGKSGHIVGISDFTPCFFFGGPVIKNKLNFSEEFSYEVNKQPIRGLAWPHNETKEQGLDSFSSVQYIISPRHLLSANVNIFPLRREFADINSLVPQSASSNYGQRGFSAVVNDSYQFGSSALLDNTFKFMRFSAYAHGQGPENMLLTPEGWGGNFFNAWTRSADQEEALSRYYQFEATLRIHPTELDYLNISYVHSRARGDLNTLADILNPFEAPVIRPDVTADLNSDVPNQLIGWGTFRLPWKLTISPVVDLHTGFPFSKVNVLQDYVGSPNSQRFPTFFSLDVKIYRDFDVWLPFFGRMKTHRLRLGVYSLNVTNHYNPHDVFNNVASPVFGHFIPNS